VVVGDYNYYFDQTALLHGLTVANDWRVGVLVDEAHNMVERARKMYSAELHQSELAALRRQLPAELRKSLDRIHRAWNALAKEQTTDYQAHDELPEKFLNALGQGIAAIADHLAKDPADVDAPLLAFYFDALNFSRLAEVFAPHSVFDVRIAPATASAKKRQSVLCIRNIVPGPFLAPRYAAARSMTLFSATLRPQAFHADILGLPDNTAWIDVASPFEASQLSVRIARHISTRYADRARSIAPIVALIAAQYTEQPGNYLAFFSSFDYLAQVSDALQATRPDIPCWRQSARMPEAEREQFLARFMPEGRGVGFAVLGGSFAEGIDLPGSRLIGAFIATLGLPQVNPVNEQMRERMEQSFGKGYDYAYFYPGMQKVVQAAGRVIRTPADRGVVHLIDDRFKRPEALRLLPEWWQVDP
jgi:Rad3-related DNA helicase